MARKANEETVNISTGPISEVDSGPSSWSNDLKTGVHDESTGGVGSSAPAASDAAPSVELGQNKFLLRQLLGRGGMAEVYLAHRTGPGKFSRKVVVKKILPERSGDPTYVKRFLREASLAAQLHHPNIVEILELGEAKGGYYIVMEYVDGKNMREVLKQAKAKKERFPPTIAARVCADVASALNYAHTFVGDDGLRRRIVHRDVSTTNIMLSFSGQVKLVDFGVAKDLDAASLTMGDQVVGKPLYLPPEAFRGGKPTLSWDIYALGLVLYKLVAGKSPFKVGSGPGGMAQLLADITSKVPERLCEVEPSTPPALDEIVATAMAKDPLDRQASAAELLTELETFLATQPPVSSTTTAWYMGNLFDRAERGSEPVPMPPSGVTTAPRSTGRVESSVVTTDVREARSRRGFGVMALGFVGMLVAGLFGIVWGDDVRAWAGKILLGMPDASDQSTGPEGPSDPEPEAVAEAPLMIGTIDIRCTAAGWVRVDGRMIGMCPPRVVSARAGTHTVTLEQDGRVVRTRTVTIKEDETVTVDLDRSPRRKKGKVRIINPTQR
ncbi:MAG: serine/threonine-protein kinase [Myxococcota bacterium]